MAEMIRKEGWDALSRFEHKTLVTNPYDLTYSYYFSPDFRQKLNKSTPVLVFSHGFPDDAYIWAGVLPTFLSLRYPFIIPDLLGFVDSTISTDPEHYRWKQQADSLLQIADN